MFYSFLCATLWASTGIFVKFINGLGINEVIFGRFLIAFIFGVIFLGRIKSLIKRDGERLIPSIMTAYYVFATYSFYFAPVSVAALFIAISPLFTLLIRIGLKQDYYINEALGFLVAFLGLILYFGFNGYSEGYTLYSTIVGGVLAVFAAALRAIFSYLIWKKSNENKCIDIHRVNVETMAIGCALFLPFTLVNHSTDNFNLLSFVSLVGLGVFATFLPNLLNNISSMKINPTTHNVIGMSTPISASIMAWLFLDERQTVFSLFSMVVVMVGIFLSTRIPSKKAS